MPVQRIQQPCHTLAPLMVIEITDKHARKPRKGLGYRLRHPFLDPNLIRNGDGSRMESDPVIFRRN